MAISRAPYYHTELMNWNKWIDFYRDEIKIFEKWLIDISQKNLEQAVKAEIEHFQNQFIIQKENFDLLKHDIHEQESKIKNDVIKNDMLINVPIVNNQSNLRDKMKTTEKIIIELKHNFYYFLEKIHHSISN